MGIEPTPSAWKAEVLPLNYTRSAALTRSPGPLPALATRVHSPGGGGRIRTYEGMSRQIYSLLPLAAWVPLRGRRAAYSRWRLSVCQRRWPTSCKGSGRPPPLRSAGPDKESIDGTEEAWKPGPYGVRTRVRLHGYDLGLLVERRPG